MKENWRKGYENEMGRMESCDDDDDDEGIGDL